MTIIVEGGTGVADANSYVSMDDCATYCDARGYTFSTGITEAKEAALIRARTSLDTTYRSRYPGYRTNGRDQELEWPRTEATDADGEEIAGDEIPQEIIDAQCEFAVRELAEAGSTMPDLERGGNVKRLKAGSVEVEYGGNATATTTFTIVDGILSGLLGGGDGGGLFATAVRG